MCFIIYGISGMLLKWLKSFLSGRLQSVKVENCLSPWSEVLSGVLQGSVLGPLLFSIFIADLAYCCNGRLSHMFLFADDGKCFSIIRSLSDAENFQSQLNAIAEWAINWQLALAPDKCSSMSYCGNNVPIAFQYKIQDQILDRVGMISDLGVIFSSNLTFS